MPVTLDTNLSLYALPIAYVVGLQPHIQQLALIQSSGIKLNNLEPRGLEGAAEKKGVPEETMRKIRRLGASHNNSIENFPIFLGALFAGYAAGLGAREMNYYAAGYLALRAAYNIAYATQTNPVIAALRSVSFWTATGWSFYVMVSAANVLRLKTSL